MPAPQPVNSQDLARKPAARASSTPGPWIELKEQDESSTKLKPFPSIPDAPPEKEQFVTSVEFRPYSSRAGPRPPETETPSSPDDRQSSSLMPAPQPLKAQDLALKPAAPASSTPWPWIAVKEQAESSTAGSPLPGTGTLPGAPGRQSPSLTPAPQPVKSQDLALKPAARASSTPVPWIELKEQDEIITELEPSPSIPDAPPEKEQCPAVSELCPYSSTAGPRPPLKAQYERRSEFFPRAESPAALPETAQPSASSREEPRSWNACPALPSKRQSSSLSAESPEATIPEAQLSAEKAYSAAEASPPASTAGPEQPRTVQPNTEESELSIRRRAGPPESEKPQSFK